MKTLAASVMCAIASVGLVACSEPSASLCDNPVSVAGYVLGFSQGLTNLDEDQFLGLRLDTLEVRDTVSLLADDDNPEVVSTAGDIVLLVDSFTSEMDDRDWNLVDALSSARVRNVIADIGSDQTLEKANLLEAAIIEKCGLPDGVSVGEETAETLPFPVVPSPTATDPPTDTIDENNEARATGEMVGNIFGLTLSEAEVLCLGRELSSIVDRSGASTNRSQYQAQYQAAFDACDIGFTVPTE